MRKSVRTMRYLADTLWSYDRSIFFYFAVSCVLGACLPYVGILMPQYIVSGLLTKEDAQYWGLLFGILGIVSIGVGGGCAVSTQAFKGRINAARNGCFGKLLTEKMQRIQYMQLEQPSVQELCFRANFLFWSETSGMAGVFTGLNQLLTGLLTLSGLVIILLGLSPYLPGILILLLMLNVHLLSKARRQENEQRPAQSKLSRELDYLSSIMHDVVAGKDIRLYGMAGYLMQWFRRTAADRRSLRRKIQRNYTRAEICGIILALLRDVFLYGYLIKEIIEGHMAADQFLLYTGSASGFTLAFGGMIENFLNIRQFLGQAKDFQEVMKLPEEPSENLSGVKMDFSHLTMKNVSFTYPNGFALGIENLSIQKGEHIALVGPNGSGKTTLVKLVLGLYRPQQGKIDVFMKNGDVISGNRFGLFSTVMQKIYQYAMTVDENICFQEYEEMDGPMLQRAILGAQLNEDIKTMPKGGRTMLRKDFDPAGVHLSGGQLQKLALARALYKDAPIMVLDEPSASLDPLAEQQLYEAFSQLFADKTCIYVSHRLSSVHFCSRIWVMDAGQMIATGTHEELMQKCSLYARMYEAQSRPYQDTEEA